MHTSEKFAVIKNKDYVEIYRRGHLPSPYYEFEFPRTENGKAFWINHLSEKNWFNESVKTQLKKLFE